MDVHTFNNQISLHLNEKTDKVSNLGLIFAFHKRISSNSSTDTVTIHTRVNANVPTAAFPISWLSAVKSISIRIDDSNSPGQLEFKPFKKKKNTQFERVGLRPDSRLQL